MRIVDSVGLKTRDDADVRPIRAARSLLPERGDLLGSPRKMWGGAERALIRSNLGETNGAGGHNVIDARSSRQVRDRFRKALQKWAQRRGARQVLGQFVGDVARVEVWENQHVRSPRHRTAVVDLPVRHSGNNRRIGLNFTIDRQIRGALAAEFERLGDVLNAFMRRAATCREREQRHARQFIEQSSRTGR